MQKISTAEATRSKVFRARQLTVGLDLGDRSSFYCVLDDQGEVILERNLSTTPKAIQQIFGRMARSRIALETGGHSPWVSRLLTQLGHEVIVQNARNVRLIGESRRKERPPGCANAQAALLGRPCMYIGDWRISLAVVGE